MKKSTTTGSFDASKAPPYISRIETVQGQIDAIMATAQEECAPLREDIASIKKEAHDNASLPRRELNSLIAKRKSLAKAENVRGRLSPEQRDNFDAMELALGQLKDTELGKAAARRSGDERASAH